MDGPAMLVDKEPELIDGNVPYGLATDRCLLVRVAGFHGNDGRRDHPVVAGLRDRDDRSDFLRLAGAEGAFPLRCRAQARPESWRAPRRADVTLDFDVRQRDVDARAWRRECGGDAGGEPDGLSGPQGAVRREVDLEAIDDADSRLGCCC